MATEIEISESSTPAKIRHPLAPLGLSLITLGIYGIFWWYFINREMRDLGYAKDEDLGTNPGLSVVAYTIGAVVIIPPFWTLVTTTQRVQRAQGVQGLRDPLNGWIAALVYILTLGIGVSIFLQHHLNRVWEAERSAPAEGPQAEEPPSPPEASPEAT